MTNALYTKDILRLASEIPHLDRLTAPNYRARKVSPICGSQIDVDAVVKSGIVTEYGQKVRACALGQASAAVMGAAVLGMSVDRFEGIAADMAAFLKGDTDTPPAGFETASVFAPAKDFKSRHASILLPFEAMAEIARQVSAAQPAA